MNVAIIKKTVNFITRHLWHSSLWRHKKQKLSQSINTYKLTAMTNTTTYKRMIIQYQPWTNHTNPPTPFTPDRSTNQNLDLTWWVVAIGLPHVDRGAVAEPSNLLNGLVVTAPEAAGEDVLGVGVGVDVLALAATQGQLQDLHAHPCKAEVRVRENNEGIGGVTTERSCLNGVWNNYSELIMWPWGDWLDLKAGDTYCRQCL